MRRTKLWAPSGMDRVHRYFFHTDDGRPFHDEDGTILENDTAARLEAARVLGQLVNEHPADVWHDDPFRITVTNDTGVILFVLDIAALVSPAAHPATRPPRPAG